MSDWKELLQEEMEQLRTVRDEIRVQAELGNMELRDQWQGLEKRWSELEGRLKRAGEVAREDMHEIEGTAKDLLREIRDGFQHLRGKL